MWAVREVTAALARRLAGIPAVWVGGEIHSVRATKGQVYFTLVDGHQLSCSMSQQAWDALDARPPDGARVEAEGRVEFWAQRATLSLRVARLELAGEGVLLRRIEAVRARLQGEGLLDTRRKRPLPAVPRRIGVVTSRQGAALQDFLAVVETRLPGVEIVLVDVPVQGEMATGGVARALALLNERGRVDVIVVTRGGGPLEDLMAFNSEMVCRAVAASRAPVVAAVGHERDVTLCELVADVRAATPTAAATAVVPSRVDVLSRLARRDERLRQGLQRAYAAADAATMAARGRMSAALWATAGRGEMRLAGVEARMQRGLAVREARAAMAVAARDARTRAGVTAALVRADAALAGRQALLTALSPFAVLGRGYAIVADEHGAAVTAAAALRPGMTVDMRFADGSARARVTDVEAVDGAGVPPGAAPPG